MDRDRRPRAESQGARVARHSRSRDDLFERVVARKSRLVLSKSRRHRESRIALRWGAMSKLPIGSFRVYDPKSRRAIVNVGTMAKARTEGEWTFRMTRQPLEIQERMPTGTWVTVGRVTKAA